MKNLIVCTAALFLLNACKKSSDGGDAGFQWPEGTGEYAPYTNGSTFVYEVTTAAPAATDSFTYTVTKDTLIDGLRYRKLESSKPTLASTLYCSYNNGVRTEITYNTTVNNINIPVIKQTVLKANEAQGAGWNEVLNVNVPGIPLPIPVTFNYTNTQKNFTKSILGKDYAATIHAKQVATIPNIPGLPPNIPTSVTVDNFFAKDYGLAQRDAPNTVYKIKRANVIK
jgi:hypothetical protein